MTIEVRDCHQQDIPAVQAIYAVEVLEGTASFETEPPGLNEMRSRFQDIVENGLPYIVAVEGDTIAGYCYASPYRARPAYQYTLENTVYVASWARRRGVGLTLLNNLIARVSDGPWHQLVAVIGGSEHTVSIRLHEQAGFRQVGVLQQVGFKFGDWVDSVLMQRQID